MSAIGWINGSALGLALAVSAALSMAPGPWSDAAPAQDPEGSTPGVPHTLRDHTGNVVVLKDFRRIVSASTIADQLLVELCEPDRIVAHTGYGLRTTRGGYRYVGKAVVESLQEIEAILALTPDLVLVSDYGDPRPIERLREAGLTVFDMGPMRGVGSLVENAREVATLLRHRERGEQFAASFERRMRSVAVDVPPAERVAGMYLSIYGGHLYGGAKGTSYHDVLTAAGLLDAADAYRDWPEYSSEAILTMDPPVIVASGGARQKLCGHTGFDRLRACREGKVVEIDDAVLGDPGLPMLEAAEAIRSAVYPCTEGTRSGGARP